MKDQNKTKQKLIEELEALRKQVTKLKGMETKRKRTEEMLWESKENFRTLAENAVDGILIAVDEGATVYANKRAAEIMGYSVAELLKTTIKDLAYPDESEKVMERYRKKLEGKSVPRQYETIVGRKDGKSVPIELAATKTIWQGQPADLVFLRDIIERKRVEEALRVSHRFLEIGNRHTGMNPLLNEFVVEVQKFTQCAAVGIRILNEEGNIPYQAYKGFSQRFYESESPLSIKSDQCMCMNVVKGVTDPKVPFYTEGGSFYMNGTTRFLATVSEEEKGQTRNICNQFGYESVAVIPIRIGVNILGLIHVADPDENKVPLRTVQILEKVAMQLGTGIHRVRVEEALQKAHNGLETRVQERTAELEKSNQALQFEIEERNQAEEALRQSEMKYRIVADNTYDWEWWRDLKGNFIYISPSCKRVTHHEAEEFIKDQDLLLKIIHPDDKSSFIRHQIEVEEKHASGEIEFRILRPDGSLRWIAHACQPVFNEQGRFLGRRGSNRDTTERKCAEEALRESEEQLRYLSSKLLTAQETERRRISRELHDELGGSLAALKLRSNFIKKNLQKDQTDLTEECESNEKYIDQIIENVHRLSRDLSPPVLEDLGLSTALRWLIDHFVKHYDIKVRFDNIDVDHQFSREAEIMIFRIFQEAFTNIGKHAQAKNVSVSIKKDVDRLSFLLEDDGKGFDPNKAHMGEATERGMGLATMRERARLLGGSFDLQSQEGKGTLIMISGPIKTKDGEGL